jgi:hypothetical protein
MRSGPHHFFPADPSARLSSIESAIIRISLGVLFFQRLEAQASDTSMPPYFAFHLHKVGELNPAPAQIRHRYTGLLLAQYPDDLLFREP